MSVQRCAWAIPLVAVLTFGGCSSADRRPSIEDVRREVAQRAEVPLVWHDENFTDEQTSALVRSLLNSPIGSHEAVRIALLNNRNLQARYAELGLAQADVLQAGLLKNPVLEAQVRIFDGGTGVEMALVQDFVQSLLIPLRTRLAQAAWQSVKFRVCGSVFDVVAQVRAAVYALQAAEQTRQLRQTIVEATSASYELALRLHEAGNISDLNLANERALHEQSKLDLADSEAEVAGYREQVNALLGLWGQDTQWTLVDRLPEMPAEEISSRQIEKRAVASSLDLEAARWDVTWATQRLNLARPLGVLQSAKAGASAEREAAGDWGVGPALVLPLPVFDTGQAAQRGAEALLRREQERAFALAVEVRARARSAWNRMAAARRRAEYCADVIVPLRHAIVEETQKEYNAMLVSAFQLLTAKRDAIEAGRQSILALRDYWLARAELEQILAGRMPATGGPPSRPDRRAMTQPWSEGDSD